MKKYVSILLCTLLLLSMSACAQPEPPKFYVSRYKMNTLGTNIQEMAYTYDDQWCSTRLETTVNGELIFWQETQYSEDNSTVTMTMYSGGETGVSESHRAFDKNGNVIKLETAMDGEPYSISYREYDRENRLIQDDTTYFSGYTQSIKTAYTYDSQGNLVCETSESSVEGTVITVRTEDTYDSQNRRTRESRFQDDEMTGYFEYTHDGLVETGLSYKPDGSLVGKMVYTYDRWGNLLTMEAYRQDGTLSYWQAYNYIGTDGTVSNGIS